MTPPIYELKGRDRLEGLDGGKREQLVDAITGGIAVGYLAMAGIEVDAQGIDPRTAVDPAEIWKLWVVRLGSTLLDETGLPRSIQDDVTNGASGYFTARLRDADLLPRMRKRMRYGLIGKWYGQAGMVLRVLQTIETPSSSEDIWQATNSWPFERAETE